MAAEHGGAMTPIGATAAINQTPQPALSIAVVGTTIDITSSAYFSKTATHAGTTAQKALSRESGTQADSKVFSSDIIMQQLQNKRHARDEFR